MSMMRGYIRLSRRSTDEATQRGALETAGVASEHIFVDDQRKKASGKAKNRPSEVLLHGRAKAIRACGAGDVLVVATAGRLGVSRKDIRQAIGEIAARGASIQAVGETPFGGPALAALVAFEANGHLEVERERLEPARKARGEAVKKRLTAAQTAVLLTLWRDPGNYTVEAVIQAAAELELKIGRRTLYALLGGRLDGGGTSE
jgi:DNA invertase Pin-like site-specific DNA recombinase